jgi:hypothetical protein
MEGWVPSERSLTSTYVISQRLLMDPVLMSVRAWRFFILPAMRGEEMSFLREGQQLRWTARKICLLPHRSRTDHRHPGGDRWDLKTRTTKERRNSWRAKAKCVWPMRSREIFTVTPTFLGVCVSGARVPLLSGSSVLPVLRSFRLRHGGPKESQL